MRLFAVIFLPLLLFLYQLLRETKIPFYRFSKFLLFDVKKKQNLKETEETPENKI